ncbi:ankyrin repeat-containing protein [Anaeramoeba flamelloides]|uniref:Ankyrin repeat-containing protein n=1 Tax=Anaeramoeba flamelloides TaxID=1746091 RepID=A0ABQ8Y3P0_9EUKA|nr:ankyrin repeat-containing protein [Anaeramoeba flamelloides]
MPNFFIQEQLFLLATNNLETIQKSFTVNDNLLIDRNHRNSLQIVCLAKQINISVVEYFLDLGVAINHQDINGLTAIHLVLRRSEKIEENDLFEIIQTLIQYGADLNIYNRLGRTAFHYACKLCTFSVELFKYLLEEGQGDLEMTTNDRFCLNGLHIVCQRRNVPIEIISLFLQTGIDLTKQDSFGKTSLHYHCENLPKLEIFEIFKENNFFKKKKPQPRKNLNNNDSCQNDQDNNNKKSHSVSLNSTDRREIENVIRKEKENKEEKKEIANKKDQDQDQQKEKEKEIEKENEKEIEKEIEKETEKDIEKKKEKEKEEEDKGQKDQEKEKDDQKEEDNQNKKDTNVEKNKKFWLIDNEGNDFYHYLSINGGDLEIYRFLLSNNFQATRLNNKKKSALQELCCSAYLKFETVKFLVNCCHCPVHSQDIYGETSLSSCCMNKKKTVQIIKFLIEKGCDPNLGGSISVSPLVAVCKNNTIRTKIVKYLMKQKGIDINKVDNTSGRTPLLLLLNKTGSKPLCNALINMECKTNIKDYEGRTCYHLLVRNFDLEMANTFFRSGCDPLLCDNDNNSPLHAICENFDNPKNQVRYITWLVEHKADVNSANNQSLTPLLILCSQKDINIDCLSLLIRNGADAAAQTQSGITALMLICKNHSLKSDQKLKALIRILIDSGSNVNQVTTISQMSALHFLVENSEIINLKKSLAYMLRSGADINLANNHHSTPFMYLCEFHADYETIKMCLNYKVNLSLFDKYNRSCLHSICLSKSKPDPKVVQLLLEAGVDPELEDFYGNTALNEISVNSGDIICSKLLIKHGSDVNHVSKVTGESILNSLLDKNKPNFELIKLCVEHGASLNYKDYMGFTPLFKVCFGEKLNIKILKYFLKNNANPNIENKLSLYPIHRVCLNKYPNFTALKLLIKYKSEINIKDPNGRTPLFEISNEDGINYIFVSKNGVYFCCTAITNVSSSFVLEIINRIIQVIKDYCQVINEEILRKNNLLLYELIDEILDYGLPQQTVSAQLDKFICSTPIFEKDLHKPMKKISKKKKNKLLKKSQPTLLINFEETQTIEIKKDGKCIRNEVTGIISMNNQVKEPSDLTMFFEPFLLGKKGEKTKYKYTDIMIEDILINIPCNSDNLQKPSPYIYIPRLPVGNFNFLNYRTSGEKIFKPFLVATDVKTLSKNKIDLVITIKSAYDQKFFGPVTVKIPAPEEALSVSSRLSDNIGQKVVFNQKLKTIIWTFEKLNGERDETLEAGIILRSGIENLKRVRSQLGPLLLTYELSKISFSGFCLSRVTSSNIKRFPKIQRNLQLMSKSDSYIIHI